MRLDPRTVRLIGSPLWLKSWFVKNLTYFSLPQRTKLSRSRMLLEQSPSFFMLRAIQLPMDWLRASLGQEETLLESPPLPQYWRVNDWSCSKKLFQKSSVLQCCGIPEAKALHNGGKKAN